MLISREQFEEEDGIITFIGPSGAGKSGRSKAMAKEWRCLRFEVDALIGQSQQMRKILRKIKGKDEAEKLGKWMGMPWSKGFPDREQEYLEIERNVLRRVMDLAGGHHTAIIDTTGSSIYDTEAMTMLSRGSLMVYLEADKKQRKKLQQKYLDDPKPVCFNGVWSPAKRERPKETLARCFPILLETRHGLYQSFADVTVNARLLKKANGATVDDLLESIWDELPEA